VTNGLTATQQEKIKACNLEMCVDFLLTSEEAGMKKPDMRIFSRALDIAKTRRENTVVIGDSWTSDVLGAHRAGIKPAPTLAKGITHPVLKLKLGVVVQELSILYKQMERRDSLTLVHFRL
jgi:FMN phosphatase YigB (HAD superfamily)